VNNQVSSGVLELVKTEARRLKPDGVLLVGSQARGIATLDSDVDVAFFVNDYAGSQLETHLVAGRSVGIELYSVGLVQHLPYIPLLGFKNLREAGRISSGVPILGPPKKNVILFQQTLSRAVLRADCAFYLFSMAEQGVLGSYPEVQQDDRERLWALQGAIAALAILTLNLSPVRFQKPKWVIQDLMTIAPGFLTDIVEPAFGLDGKTARVSIEVLSQALESGFNLLHRPIGGATHSNSEERRIRYYFKGTKELMFDGSWKPAIYNALSALRMVESSLQKQGNRSEFWKVQEWKRDFLDAIVGSHLWPKGYQLEVAGKTREYGSQLLERYKTTVASAKARGGRDVEDF
jgi:hypothetical protein